MADPEQLRKMIQSTDIVIFAARRGDGCHAAIIHMRDLSKDQAQALAMEATISPVRTTHWSYSNERGGIAIAPER